MSTLLAVTIFILSFYVMFPYLSFMLTVGSLFTATLIASAVLSAYIFRKTMPEQNREAISKTERRKKVMMDRYKEEYVNGQIDTKQYENAVERVHRAEDNKSVKKAAEMRKLRFR
jgi:uncharacterized membrane protein